MLKMRDLESCFKTAREKGVAYIGVKFKNEKFERPEIIINESEDFDKKLEYYKKYYNDDLILNEFSGRRIVGLSYGDSLGYIENELLW